MALVANFSKRKLTIANYKEIEAITNTPHSLLYSKEMKLDAMQPLQPQVAKQIQDSEIEIWTNVVVVLPDNNVIAALLIQELQKKSEHFAIARIDIIITPIEKQHIIVEVIPIHGFLGMRTE